jgi:alkanesulfonate monooxygenase SsuD/methylene tetrahydromethanopterin reductase-like flavin-dependent oxidoreductase (luciferase family)
MTQTLSDIALSMLDLVAVRQGGTVADALAIALRTAQHAESLGFKRYWLAEHHNMAGIASSATAVLVGLYRRGHAHDARGLRRRDAAQPRAAGRGRSLRYPGRSCITGRIDLGLGRAPGTDRATMRALRRDRVETEEDFPRDVAELQQLLGPVRGGQQLIAMPGAGTQVPIWLLGSSLFSARLAAERGLPYAFASHFAPRLLLQALELYRSLFRPSATLAKPYVVIGVPLIAAPTDDEAEFLASSTYQRVLGILTGDRQRLQPPVADFMAGLIPAGARGDCRFPGGGRDRGAGHRARGSRAPGRNHASRRIHAGQRRVRPGTAPALARHRRASDALTRRRLSASRGRIARAASARVVSRVHPHAQAEVGARIGIGQRGVLVDATGVEQLQQHLVEGVHADAAALLDRVADLVDRALEDQVGHIGRMQQQLGGQHTFAVVARATASAK